MKAVEPKENYFGVNDFDNVDAILFRFKREQVYMGISKCSAYIDSEQEKRKFLVKAISTEDMDKFEEFTDRILR